MIELRTAREHELDWLSGIPTDDGGKFAGQVREMLAEGTTRSEWIYVAVADGDPVVRLGFMADEPPANAPLEMYLFGLAFDWDRAEARDAALALLREALPVVARVGPPIDARVNPEVHADFEQRRALLENAGFWLFQEKEGYVWRAENGVPARSSRLSFRTLREVGHNAFVDVLSRGPAGTLDRNDRYYYEASSPAGWARVMMGFAGPGDETTWKLAYDADGDSVGYVMVSGFDEHDTGTIAHIGVVPEERGRGYINDLVAEATHDAVARGFSSILSDADVLNVPMGAALERAGHRRGVRPWHVWHYRYPAPYPPDIAGGNRTD